MYTGCAHCAAGLHKLDFIIWNLDLSHGSRVYITGMKIDFYKLTR